MREDLDGKQDQEGDDEAAADPGLRNAVTAARFVAAAALARRESRGGHEREDYPQTDDAQAHRTFLLRSDVEAIEAEAAGPLTGEPSPIAAIA